MREENGEVLLLCDVMSRKKRMRRKETRRKRLREGEHIRNNLHNITYIYYADIGALEFPTIDSLS